MMHPGPREHEPQRDIGVGGDSGAEIPQSMVVALDVQPRDQIQK